MKRKIFIAIIIVFFLALLYRFYSFWQVRSVVNDFEAIIQGKDIDNAENKIHLERYLPDIDYVCTDVSCNHVQMFGNKAKMYMELEYIRIMTDENGKVTTEKIPDKFVMDVEKKDGTWSISRVEIVP